MYYHKGSVINSSTRLGNNICHYFNTDQVVYLPNSRANTLVAIDLIDHNTCLASQYRRNKASRLRHTHLHTLNSDHYVHGSVLVKLPQSYTPPRGGGGDLWLLMFKGTNKSDCNLIPDRREEGLLWHET